MEENQPALGSRALVVAGIFAFGALLALFLVWRWAPFFGIEIAKEQEGAHEELTREEKFAILARIRASEPDAIVLSAEEKAAALQGLSASRDDTDREEKMQVLQSLN